MSEASARILARGIVKNFGGVRALRGVDFAVHPGEVRAIVGENGAGKSTLTKVLSGVVEPDSGEIALSGVPTRITSPMHARQLGIAVVHQELELAGALSIAENLFLGTLPGRFGLLSRRDLYARARAALEQLGCAFDPFRLVRTLSVAEQQIVEIARAIVQDARTIFFDEPTAALSPVEAGRVHDRIRRLRDSGVAIVYISHNLDDVLDIADRITVMRDGRVVAETAAADTDRATLVQEILGRELAALDPAHGAARSDPVLRCRNLSTPPGLDTVSFDVNRSEIVGFFGLLGAGQGLIAETLFGQAERPSGEVEVLGQPGVPADARQAMSRGLGYVPPDRKRQGLALDLSIQDNLTMTCPGQISRFGLFDRHKAAAIARKAVADFDIRCSGIHQKAGALSGGNQQKIVLGKWQASGARIMLLEQPTRGVDVGARGEIYRIMRRHAEAGGASLVFSSDAEEISMSCDRAYVLRKGRIAAEIGAAELSVSSLLRAAL